MKLSTKGKYGLIALADLALAYRNQADGSYIVLKTIAQKRGISEAYLERIISLLKKADIVRTQRGSLGGYSLARAPMDIKVSEILYVLEGPLDVCGCGIETGCSKQLGCVSNLVGKEINAKIKEAIEHMTLEDVLRSYDETE